VHFSLWNGEAFGASADEALARVHVKDRATLVSLVTNPEMAFGDAYMDGALEIQGDLVGLLEQSFRRMPNREGWEWWVTRLVTRLLRNNSLMGARRHIQRHYDLGNDFYRLWLDRDLVYTCAYFPEPGASLEVAQQAKLEHVCRKLRLRPGEEVVEAGCGWGALALYMAREYGVRVRAFNISEEQVAFARERAEQLGLGGRVEFVQDDYRNVTGRYDAFVSVGMLEHVGRSHYTDLGAVIDRSLTAQGRGFLHSIGRAQPHPLHPWIEKRIFPGAHPPTLAEIVRVLQPGGLAVLDVENLRVHYARTLEHWLARFEDCAAEVESRFDASFVRMWRLYLASSIASFRAGSLQLFQVLFARAGHDGMPWTRADLYGRS
jgi:cyclopropane-fatty-acyl-phospholipid synthase